MKSTNSDSIDLYNQQELVFLPPPCCIKGYFNKLYYLICILWRCIQGHVPDNWTILGRNLTKIKRLIFRINMSFNKSYPNHRKKIGDLEQKNLVTPWILYRVKVTISVISTVYYPQGCSTDLVTSLLLFWVKMFHL